VEAGPADPRWRGYDAEVTESDRGVEVLVREQLPDVDFPPGQGMSRMGWPILLPVNLCLELRNPSSTTTPNQTARLGGLLAAVLGSIDS
jgi:hypothetical protein